MSVQGMYGKFLILIGSIHRFTFQNVSSDFQSGRQHANCAIELIYVLIVNWAVLLCSVLHSIVIA